MLKLEILILALFVAVIVMIGYVMVDFTQDRIEKTNWCAQAGGIPIVGDKGHFKLCLRPEAVIQLPKE
jgi:hypothetical protein